MGTKAMVFPMDENGNVYVVHDENDNLIGTGSRETCYRLLGLIAKPRQPKDEGELVTASPSEFSE